MYRSFIILLLVFVFIDNCFPADLNIYDKTLKDNPGYFKTPGFIAIGISNMYTLNKNTKRDKAVNPMLIGVLNIAQNEYGTIALSLGSTYISPSIKVGKLGDDIRYNLNMNIKTLEYGINYLTSSQSINYWVGVGYNTSFVDSNAKSFENISGAGSNFNHKFNTTVQGWHYYLGFQFFPVKRSPWSLFFLFRGQETKRKSFTIDSNIKFNDGSTKKVYKNVSASLSNKSYVFGVAYNF